jgi:hypothetical protein
VGTSSYRLTHEFNDSERAHGIFNRDQMPAVSVTKTILSKALPKIASFTGFLPNDLNERTAKIDQRLCNTITTLCTKRNIMLFSWNARRRLLRRISCWAAGLHFRTQASDEMLDVKRQRRTTFHRDVSIELGRLNDP